MEGEYNDRRYDVVFCGVFLYGAAGAKISGEFPCAELGDVNGFWLLYSRFLDAGFL